MINLEKYADKLMKSDQSLNCSIRALRAGTDDCTNYDCFECKSENVKWLMQEYKEPEIDWSKVKRGTPVLVSNRADTEWIDLCFYDYDANFDFPFAVFRDKSYIAMSRWKYCKLKEGE